jgi:hypothetical protein
MDSLFRQAPYAEDQTNAHSILYLHVIRASTMSFAFISLLRFPISVVRARYSNIPVMMSALTSSTLRSSGRAGALGAAVGAFATWGRMRGREEIEWQDRAWRILGNQGENQTDWATMSGVGAGAVAGVVAARRGVIPPSVGSAMSGGAAAGSAVGKKPLAYYQTLLILYLRHTFHDCDFCNGKIRQITLQMNSTLERAVCFLSSNHGPLEGQSE